MKGSSVKGYFGRAKQKLGDERDQFKNQILTGYMSEEIHRKIRRLNIKKTNVH